LKKDIILKENESLDELQIKDYKIIQSGNHFKFSIDAVLLSHFSPVKKNTVVMDMCSGTGIVALLLYAHNHQLKRIDCVEIQKDLFEMCVRSVRYNEMDKIVFPYNMDLRDTPGYFGYEKYDMIFCNPPYLPLSAGETSLTEEKRIARFEVFGNLNDIITTSSKLIKNKGKLVLSHRPERFTDIVSLMRENKIEPKRCQFVHSQLSKPANILLIEGIKNGKPNMIIEPPLIVYDENNNYTSNIHKIYKGDLL